MPEFVSEGHPDKTDRGQMRLTLFSSDPEAAETAVYTGSVHVLVKFLQMLMWISTVWFVILLQRLLYLQNMVFCGDWFIHRFLVEQSMDIAQELTKS